MPKSFSSSPRTASPFTPSGITTATTLFIFTDRSPKI